MNIFEKLFAWLGNNNEFCGYYPIVVKYKFVHPAAKAPFKANPTDAGWDLSCVSGPEVDDDGNFVYHTGLALEIPEGHVGLLFPRSSIAKKNMLLSNSVGVVDCHFRGEVLAKFKPYYSEVSKHKEYHIYEKGDRICQLIVIPILEVEMEEAVVLSKTDRGEGGYGSSGA